MKRITDNKTIGPIRRPEETRGREPAPQREVPVPPGAKLASTALNAVQRAENQRLIALYHALKEKKSSESASKDFEVRLKDWKKRTGGKKKNKSQQNSDTHQATQQDPKDDQDNN